MWFLVWCIAVSAQSSFWAVGPDDVPLPPAEGPACLPSVEQGFQDLLRALVVISNGTSADSLSRVYTYLSYRGAIVQYACPLGQDPVVLLDVYRPTYMLPQTICTFDVDTTSLDSFDIVAMVDGFSSTLPLRQKDSLVRALTEYSKTNSKVLLLSGSATELLVEGVNISRSIVNGSIPQLSPPTVLSVARNCAECLNDPNITYSVLSMMNGSSTLALSTREGLTEALMAVGALFGAEDSVLNCSADSSPIERPVGAINVTGAMWSTLLRDTDANQTIPDVVPTCINSNGVNFCDGLQVAFVVAHGSHALSVMAMHRAWKAAGSRVSIFCPDTDERMGAVFLMSDPPLAVTHGARCDEFYNTSLLAERHGVIVPHGVIATHRRLRVDGNFLAVLNYRAAFALQGSALALLGAVAASTTADVAEVPPCALTDDDVALAGLTVGGSPAAIWRDTMDLNMKVLGGCDKPIVAGVANFSQMLASGFVFPSAETPTGDRLAVVLFISTAVVVTVAEVVRNAWKLRDNKRRHHYEVIQ